MNKKLLLSRKNHDEDFRQRLVGFSEEETEPVVIEPGEETHEDTEYPNEGL
jgi:hypothetical protein